MHFDHLASRVCAFCNEEDDFFLDESTGDYVCKSCARVQPERYVDTGKEWREFDDDERSGDRQRTELADDDFGSLGTQISLTNYGSNTVSQAAKTMNKYSKMVPTSRSETFVKHAFARINELGERLTLNVKVCRTAKDVVTDFEKIRDKTKRGYSGDAFIAAVLLVACKREKAARTLKAVATGTGVPERDVARFYKMLLRGAELRPKADDADSLDSEQATELVEVFCNRLALPFNVIKGARAIAEAAGEIVSGRRPASIAAAAIMYMLQSMCRQINPREMAAVCGVAQQTVRNVLKALTRSPVHDAPLACR
eukprot:TRINITY_DN252_c0_g1_i2.p1 TRINITY_DN252_c0_g1~~TRINITY_DN252_c0_g1_i2.p1  ORF type:complete len:337 (-),score=80.38 TRINITY_DN252_c0_g1_i2:191-1123(-)